jgi:hypothetical protein
MPPGKHVSSPDLSHFLPRWHLIPLTYRIGTFPVPLAALLFSGALCRTDQTALRAKMFNHCYWLAIT